ncbi:hypothetical protein [uncultured Methanobrevibacter sp.]|uniref:hypothetical protein n=1 Tax=uncultured Methanobrevibacter sp. TaxID=253161 RepID=UPI00259045D0|nr:hypothetical protein [uncultured Methanobrevibacter sp.]
MDNERTIIAILILIVCCLIGGLIYTVSLSSEPVNNTTLNNTANITNNTTNDTADVCQVSDEHESSSSVSSQSKDLHSDWVCEGDTWYSKQDSDGKGYVLYDKASGRPIGSGDMPDRHGYHSQNYIDMYSSTVKYRSNGEYYDD